MISVLELELMKIELVGWVLAEVTPPHALPRRYPTTHCPKVPPLLREPDTPSPPHTVPPDAPQSNTRAQAHLSCWASVVAVIVVVIVVVMLVVIGGRGCSRDRGCGRHLCFFDPSL